MIKTKEDATHFLHTFREFGIYSLDSRTPGHIYFRENETDKYTIDDKQEGFIGVPFWKAVDYIFRNRKYINSFYKNNSFYYVPCIGEIKHI